MPKNWYFAPFSFPGDDFDIGMWFDSISWILPGLLIGTIFKAQEICIRRQVRDSHMPGRRKFISIPYGENFWCQ